MLPLPPGIVDAMRSLDGNCCAHLLWSLTSWPPISPPFGGLFGGRLLAASWLSFHLISKATGCQVLLAILPANLSSATAALKAAGRHSKFTVHHVAGKQMQRHLLCTALSFVAAEGGPKLALSRMFLAVCQRWFFSTAKGALYWTPFAIHCVLGEVFVGHQFRTAKHLVHTGHRAIHAAG